jgi:1-aminocyclopropane-1-carboxylate deaminase
MLRLDLLGGSAPGNKSFKLRPFLEQARQQSLGRLVSFGGPWSNHLHALAAAGKDQGFETIGIVRGEAHEADTAMLADVRHMGMQIVRLSRAEYRRRNEAAFLAEYEAHFGPCLIIPEGGSSVQSAQACIDIAKLITRERLGSGTLILPVGTGTTLAGVVSGLDPCWEVLGISALKGANDLPSRVQTLLDALAPEQCAHWSIDHRFHCGGFARVSPELKAFTLAFEAAQSVPLEPVYGAKVLLAVSQMLSDGELDESAPVVVIHTGGLQGRRGYSWLAPPGDAD